jgi:hypothetical protein
MEQSISQEKERGRAEFRQAPDVEGVTCPDVDWKLTDYHYMEIVTPNRVDMVYHIFALPEDPGAWAPPDGTARMVEALTKAKDATRLQVGEKWAEVIWEPAAVPEYFHRAMQRFEGDVQRWLIQAGIMPGTIRCDELLKEIKKRGYPVEWTDFQKHLALVERVRKEGMRSVLVQFGHDDLPEVPGPDVAYLDSLVPTKPGSWYIRVFDLINKVMDRGQLADALLDVLLRG